MAGVKTNVRSRYTFDNVPFWEPPPPPPQHAHSCEMQKCLHLTAGRLRHGPGHRCRPAAEVPFRMEGLRNICTGFCDS